MRQKSNDSRRFSVSRSNLILDIVRYFLVPTSHIKDTASNILHPASQKRLNNPIIWTQLCSLKPLENKEDAKTGEEAVIGYSLQVVSRAWRMGATRPIRVETLAMRGTIEEEMVHVLQVCFRRACLEVPFSWCLIGS